MRIAIVGTRGIPGNYGGFETFAEQLSTRLVKRGYEVYVYCRKGNSSWTAETYKGVHLVTLPTIKHKYFDTIANTFIATWHVAFSKADVVYYCNAINSLFMILPRMFGKKVIINVDGLEWKRTKWNKLGKFAYQVSERIATVFAHHIISDSKAIRDYYKKKFNKETQFIPYGAERKDVNNSQDYIKKHGLSGRKYLLYVSRLEPENNAHIMIKAYEKTKTDYPLVIVGDAPYGKPYIQELRATKDKRIKFLGGIYGEGYQALQSNAYIYLHGNEVGGTNPALLEAMAFGNCSVVNGVDFNREVIGDPGFWFQPGDADDLHSKLEHLLRNPQEVEECRVKAAERIVENYSWEDVVAQYDHFFKTI